MSEAKTYVFGNESSGMMNMIAPLLQQRGLDPNIVFAMMNNRNGDWGNNGMWWIIILFFLLWGRNGWGNECQNGMGNSGYDYLANLINNDKSSDLIMSAVQGNATAISQLATTLNCDVNSIQQAINALGGQVCQVGNQVGLSSQQVINAIQLGNLSITSQLCNCCCDLKTLIASCCCDVKDSITRGNYENQIATLNQTNLLQQSINSVAAGQERGFSNLGYATQQQTCDLQNTINAGIQRVIDGLSAAELRELQARISKQNEELSSFKTAGIISLQLAPINGALATLQNEVNAIKCAQPSTLTLPNPTAVAVPSCVAANYGFWGNNGLFGNFNGYGSWA